MFVLGLAIGAFIVWFCCWAWYNYPDNKEKYRVKEAEHRLQRKRIEAEIDYINAEIDDTLMERQRG